MRPVSDAFLRTIRGSHRMLARATVCTTFQSGVTPTGTRIGIVAGDVVADGNADIRSTLDLTTTGPWPATAGALLAPYGDEVYVERGVQYSDALVEWVGLGYFRIDTPEQDRVPGGPVRLSGQDRMAGIIDGRLLYPVQFAAGTSLGTVVSTLVHEVYPTATVEWDDSTSTTTLTRAVLVERERFEFLDDLVTSRGKIWYWDHRGILVIKDPPDPTDPVFTVDSGAGGVLISMSRHLTRDGVYNAVVASSAMADATTPVRAVVVDDNPASPTWFYGPFGPVPRYYASPLLETVGQTAAAARTILIRGLGLPYVVEFSAVPNPALEPWDPVLIRSGDADVTHVLGTVTIPLVADRPMTATTREQHTILP